MECTGQNGSVHGSEPFNSPVLVDQRAGIERVVTGNFYARLGLFHLNWSEPVLVPLRSVHPNRACTQILVKFCPFVIQYM